MTAHELCGPVSNGVFPRCYRKTIKVAVNVGGQLVSRSVAALRVLTHRHQRDVVQITCQVAKHGAWWRRLEMTDDLGGLTWRLFCYFVRPFSRQYLVKKYAERI